MTSSRTRPLVQLTLRALPGLAPFTGPIAAAAAAEALRHAAGRLGATVLAFAVLPGELDILLADVESEAAETALRSALTRTLNRALGRRGTLLDGKAGSHSSPAAEQWLTLAEAIEQRVVAEDLAAEPGHWIGCSAHPDQAEWVGRRLEGSPTHEKARSEADRVSGPIAATVGDAIAVADLPTVVRLSDVVPALSSFNGELAGSLLAEWQLEDRATLSVVRRLLRGLGQSSGQASLVTGLYGAGKSHLLSALALLARHERARQVLAAAQPGLANLAPALSQRGDRLVVVVQLDEQPPGAALEDVVFEAAQSALAEHIGQAVPLAEAAHVLSIVSDHVRPVHHDALDKAAGGSWERLAAEQPSAAAALAQVVVREQRVPISFSRSRTERLALLLEAVAAAGLGGVVLLIDELSLFLGSKAGAALQADASFLQFVGQRASLQPLWVVAALQKQIEDVGDIEYYSLRQIKDRYETRLTLPLAATRAVLAKRVIKRVDQQRFDHAVEVTARAWSGGARLPDLTAKRLAEVYPLHPLTMDCLLACAERFLSQTRGVLEFAINQVRGDGSAPGLLAEPVPALVTPASLWEYLAPELGQHSQFGPFRAVVWNYYERNLPVLVEAEHVDLARRALATLLVLAVSGLERNVRDLAAALEPASEARESWLSGVLEGLRQRGSWLSVERRPGPGQDIWRIDLAADANETIRRRARALEATLAPTDGRLVTVAAESCIDSAFPLSTTLHPRVTEIEWRQTMRPVFVALRDLRTLSAEELSNQAALLAGPELDEAAYLYLGEPRAVEDQAASWAAALAGVEDGRWAQALVAWLPREATAAERQSWVEDVALELLRGDPTLTPDDPVKVRLDEDTVARRSRLAGLLTRLYADGSVLSRDGARPIGSGPWQEVVARVLGQALDRVFPAFAALAPRRRLPARDAVDRLIAEFVIPGEVTESPDSALACEIEDLALPLGIAAGERGEYRVSLTACGTARDLVAQLPQRPVSLTSVERWLVKSEYGLTIGQTHLLLAACLRRGHLLGLDDSGQPAPLVAPLRARLASITPAPLLDERQQAALRPLIRTVFDRDLTTLGLGQQQALWERLVNWREATLAGAASLRAALDTASDALDADRRSWRDTLDAAARAERLAELVDPALPARDGLLRLVEETTDLDEGCLPRFRAAMLFAEYDLEPLLRAKAELAAAEVPLDHALTAQRQVLLRRLVAGESLIGQSASWLEEYGRWRSAYAAAYASHHAALHAPERFAVYDEFRIGPEMRALGNLSRLPLDVPDGARQVSEALRAERSRQCRRGDIAPALRSSWVCDECRLPLGAELPLRPVAELQAQARRGIDEL